MLKDNQNLQIQPTQEGIVISLESHYSTGAVLITRHVKFNEDPKKYWMAIEAAIIYLKKKVENTEL